jgi:cytochrome c-type biogenesis protein
MVVTAHALAFVAGFSLVFVAIWTSVGLVGYLFHDAIPLLRRIGGVLIIIMGLHVAGVWRIPFLYRQQRWEWEPTAHRRLPASFLLGILFAAGWTPCIGPILSGIIGLASLGSTVLRGSYLLVAYSAGLGIPFIVCAWLWATVSRNMPSLGKYNTWISIVSGIMLIAIGLLMLTDTFARLAQLVPWIIG